MLHVALTKSKDTAMSLIYAFIGKCENKVRREHMEWGEEDFKKLLMPQLK